MSDPGFGMGDPRMFTNAEELQKAEELRSAEKLSNYTELKNVVFGLIRTIGLYPEDPNILASIESETHCEELIKSGDDVDSALLGLVNMLYPAIESRPEDNADPKDYIAVLESTAAKATELFESTNQEMFGFISEDTRNLLIREVVFYNLVESGTIDITAEEIEKAKKPEKVVLATGLRLQKMIADLGYTEEVLVGENGEVCQKIKNENPNGAIYADLAGLLLVALKNRPDTNYNANAWGKYIVELNDACSYAMNASGGDEVLFHKGVEIEDMICCDLKYYGVDSIKDYINENHLLDY